MIKHYEFLRSVQSYVEQNPDVAAKISDFVQAGLNARIEHERQRSNDMEVALSVALNKRYKEADEYLIQSKLSRWKGECSLDWNWYLNRGLKK